MGGEKNSSSTMNASQTLTAVLGSRLTTEVVDKSGIVFWPRRCGLAREKRMAAGPPFWLTLAWWEKAEQWPLLHLACGIVDSQWWLREGRLI